MNDIAIRIENVSKCFTIGSNPAGYQTFRESLMTAFTAPFRKRQGQKSETIWVLNDVSFDVRKGEAVGIIGRNGAGKSTLLKILSRITKPTRGQVRLRGRVGSLLEVGTGFHPELTGRENVYLNGAILGMKRWEIDRKFDEIINFAEVEKFLETPVKFYSSGMYMRLAFSVAAHLEPEILLVDEVLAVGDIEFQKKCLGRMGQVTNEGSTVILVSHNMSSVRTLCSEAVLLDCGRIKAMGSVDEVIEKYLLVNKPDASEKLLRDEDHFTGINKMRVNRIRLINAHFGSFSVFWQQPISVSLEIDVITRVEEVSFGAGIRTIDGVPVLTVHQDDNGSDRWDFDPGTYIIHFTIQNNLRPGLYKLGIGAHEKFIAKNLCYLPDAVDIEILDHSNNGELPIIMNAGLVNGYSTWEPPKLLRQR